MQFVLQEAARARALGLANLLAPAFCLNPPMLREVLGNLEAQLGLTATNLMTQQMRLAEESAVRLERFLLPFLRDAEAFFRYVRLRVHELQALVAMALNLIGTEPASSVLAVARFECRDAVRIRSNLQRIDAALSRISRLISQMEAAYLADAERIYQVIRRQVNAPVIQPEPGAIPAPQRPRMPSMAEQVTLATAGMVLREVTTSQMLLQEALSEIRMSVAGMLLRQVPVRLPM